MGAVLAVLILANMINGVLTMNRKLDAAQRSDLCRQFKQQTDQFYALLPPADERPID